MKNYYITHCDEQLISTVEKLFDSAQLNSNFKIIFFTINFSYESTKYKNVIPIRLDIDFNYKKEQNSDYKRRNMLLIKPKVCLEAFKIDAANYCYLDADNILLQNSDDIFKDAKKISKYPMLGLNCHQYMINGKFGNPFENGPFDLSLCLEARALKELNIPLEKRTPIYRQSNVFLFNYKCKDLINLWQDTCQKMMNSEALDNTFYDETVLNCLLWGEDNNEHLNYLTINLPIHENMKKFSLAFKNPSDETYIYSRFCKILNYNDINNIKFFHGYVNDGQYKFLKENILTKSKNDRKIIFLAPHLSTGGSPAYLKWLIEKKLSENYSVKVIEYCFYGADYVVQRNEIRKIIGEKNFINFGSIQDSEESYIDKSDILIDFINKEDPSEIHLNEMPEEFSAKPLTDKIKKFLYSSRRRFKIFETCHSSKFNFENKVLLPDEFHFCSPFHLKASKNLNVPKKIVEMEIPKKKRPKRSEALKKLGLSSDYFHVLNVGLFMANKNQKFLFDLAEKLKHKKIKFHFIGNTCFLNDCGIPENLLSLDNCVIHGEKDNVDEYMAAMDLFAFPSLLELNPIALKEALSWGMDVYLNKLDVYADYFDNNELVTYIEGNNLFNYLKSIEQTCQNIGDGNEFKHSIENSFGKIEKDSDINVVNESGALGDCLGWTPVVNQYALDINKKINFYTPHKHLFNESKYPLINFIDYSSKNQIKQNEKTIKIGCFDKKNISTPLQKLVADILQVDEKNILNKKPFLNESYISDRPFQKKYVCIATQSTAQLKYWNNPEGWNQTVDYLKNLGYEVVCIDRYSHYGNGEKVNIIPENALHYPGKSMADIINCLHHSEFMIGLSSGLSWLAWACKKPVIMVCGFLESEYHFETPYYVQNTEVCNNCWHNPKHIFDAGNWMWCPENKDFECSKMISFDQVKENIDKCISDIS